MGTLLYTADLHGNSVQYEKLFSIAKEKKISVVVIGGDLTPKDAKKRTIEAQKKFLQETFANLLKCHQSVTVCVIMGNDDFKDNIPFLKLLSKQNDNLVVLNEKPVFVLGFQMAGYSYVPLNPFKFQDWVKIDVPDIREETYRTFSLEGFLSKNRTLIPNKIDLNKRNDTLWDDLQKIGSVCRGTKAIWVVHTPPFNSILDITHNNQHVGSIAVKRAIEKYQPKISLHGHIHEAVAVSGNFMQKIGKTVCLSPGNSPNGDTLSYLLVDLEQPEKSKRFET